MLDFFIDHTYIKHGRSIHEIPTLSLHRKVNKGVRNLELENGEQHVFKSENGVYCIASENNKSSTEGCVQIIFFSFLLVILRTLGACYGFYSGSVHVLPNGNEVNIFCSQYSVNLHCCRLDCCCSIPLQSTR